MEKHVTRHSAQGSIVSTSRADMHQNFPLSLGALNRCFKCSRAGCQGGVATAPARELLGMGTGSYHQCKQPSSLAEHDCQTHTCSWYKGTRV